MIQINVAVIDSDFITNRRQRFPNLACMKISAYHKSKGDTVTLKAGYGGLEKHDKVYISKVFTETHVPESALSLPHVTYGGTGFFYDKVTFLPPEIEHIKPDYNLYDGFIGGISDTGDCKAAYKYFTDYSIGYTTRFCFRKCGFCVNRNYDGVRAWAAIDEFYDPERKKICLLDDNLFGYPEHYGILEQLQKIGKPFQYKQGLDIKLLNNRNAALLASSRYDGEYLFSFDDVADSELIIRKLELWRGFNTGRTKLYVLCAYDRRNQYDGEFWAHDIKALFQRIRILFQYKCLPYVMRYSPYKNSPFYGTYVNIASWCNQPRFGRTLSYEEYCRAEDKRYGGNTATIRYLEAFRREYPDIAREFYGLRY